MNRFIAINRQMSELDRLRGRNGGRTSALSLTATATATTSRSASYWSHPLSAAQRALVVLIENGGVDLGIPELVERLLSALPGASLIPQSIKDELVRGIRQGLRSATDSLLEEAELALNRYTGAKPEHYGDVVILRNGSALFSELRDTLVRLTQQQRIIDLLVLTHGGPDSIALAGGSHINGAQIRSIKASNGGRPLRLRSVYMMNCHASTLNSAWRDIGAAVSAGSKRNNYLPEPTTFFFFSHWKAGRSFNDAVIQAYRGTIEAMNSIIRNAANTLTRDPLGIAGKLAESLADLEHRGFVLDSAPEIAGDSALTIQSDSIAFGSSFGSAYTIVPAARGLSGPPRVMTHTISQAGIDLIKSFEGFRANLYNDPAGHCTIGYGTLVHRGNCNGAASEGPYSSGVTEARATELLLERVNNFQRAVNDSVTVELQPHQYDALVSFVYNIGTGAFASSTLLRKLNDGDYAAVPVELRKWVKAGGKTLPGLVRRRDTEAQMFEGSAPASSQSLYTRAFQQPRGIRNNNPGNLRISNQAWEGKVATNTDGEFEQFSSYEYGVRALILLLRNYLRGDRNTLSKIISAYAPASDGNHTNNYITFMVDRLKQGGLTVDADTELTIDRTTLRLLAQGIARMENGEECITDEQFDAGFALLSEQVRNTIAQSLGYHDWYRGLGEVAEESEVGEREDIPYTEGMEVTLAAHCPVNPAESCASTHFSMAEFNSRDGVEVPRQLRGNVQALMHELEVLRGELGQPITVISGYRSPAHNSAVGGVPRSQHLCATAADIKVKEHTPREVYDAIERLISAGRMRQGGLGIYSTFVHYDIRGGRARW